MARRALPVERDELDGRCSRSGVLDGGDEQVGAGGQCHRAGVVNHRARIAGRGHTNAVVARRHFRAAGVFTEGERADIDRRAARERGAGRGHVDVDRGCVRRGVNHLCAQIAGGDGAAARIAEDQRVDRVGYLAHREHGVVRAEVQRELAIQHHRVAAGNDGLHFDARGLRDVQETRALPVVHVGERLNAIHAHVHGRRIRRGMQCAQTRRRQALQVFARS